MRTIYACLLIWLIPVSSFAGAVDISEALKKGLILVRITAQGGHSGEAIRLSLGNKGKKTLEIRIPAGQVFEAVDSSLQNLMALEEKLLTLEAGKTRPVGLQAACVEAGDASPFAGSAFNLGALASGQLLKVAQFIHEHRLFNDPSAQNAVWAVTDGHPLTYINHEGLANLVAETLGKSPPEYAILHQQQSVPGEPAFRHAPAKLEGVFKYDLQQEKPVSFGLYNDKGEAVHHFFKDRKQLRGYHKFRFTFEIRNLPPGKYSVRLVEKNGTVIKSMDVEF